MKRIAQILFTLAATASLFAATKPSLDGRAVVAEEGVLPRGLFAKTVGYLPGDSVSVTNPTTGVTINVLVLGSLDPSSGVAILLSPEAADKLFITPNANVQVKITKRTGLLDETASGSAVIAQDPDKDASASIPDELEKSLESMLAETEIPAAQESMTADTEVPPEETVAEAIPEEELTAQETVAEALPEELAAEETAVAEVSPEDELTAQEAVAEIPPEDELAAQETAVAEVPPVEEIVAEEAVAEILPEEELTAQETVAEILPEDELAAEETVAEVSPVEEIVAEEAVAEILPEDESDPFAPIVLIPAEDNPPVTTDIVIAPEPVVPVAPEKSAVAAAVPPAERAETAAATSGRNIIPSLSSLESGKYYVQIATLAEEENIRNILDAYSGKYPLVMVPLKSGKAYQIMVGPLNVDEYGTILARFKSFGYKDAFLRKIR